MQLTSVCLCGGTKGLDKPSLHDKFDEEPDITAIPPEVQYLSDEELKALDNDEAEYDEDDFAAEDLDVEEDEEDDEEDDDDDLSPEEWAENFEREVAEWDQEDGETGAGEGNELEDDRLYIVRCRQASACGVLTDHRSADDRGRMCLPCRKCLATTRR